MRVRFAIATLALALTTGCATGLNSVQKAELDHYEARGMAVQEKNPGLGAGLGLLPGGGSFYGREYGFGVVNLLLWPLSILWDPVSGYEASRSINYQATRTHIERQRKKALDELDAKLAGNEIDLKAYTLQRRQVEERYTAY